MTKGWPKKIVHWKEIRKDSAFNAKISASSVLQLIIIFWKMRRGKTATILSNNTKNIIPVLRLSQTNSPTTAVIPQKRNQYRKRLKI